MRLMQMNLPFDVPLNPLDWPSPIFVLLIVVAIVLRLIVPWRPHIGIRVLREILVILPAAILYFLVRGLVGASEATAVQHAEQIISLERRLGIWWEPRLQEFILGSTWRIDLVNWIYIWAHWPVIALVVTWLILRHFDRYPQYRSALLISGVIGMIIFATYPVAPPRLMPGYDFVDTVSEQSNSYRLLQPPALANPYAAMPSLHFGWNLLMGIALVREASQRTLRVAGVLIPVAMLLSIVLSANHYLLDAVAGGVIVSFSLAIATPLTTLLTTAGTSLRGRIGPDNTPERSRATLRTPARGRDREGGATTLNGLVNRPFIVAHRYGNSLEELKLAEQAGADIIEADVWPYRGQFEVRHTKTAGPLPVLWDRWSLEPGWKPRFHLAELVTALQPDTLLMIDIKGRYPVAEEIVETLRAARRDVPVLVCSQNWEQVDRFRPYPQILRVYSIGNRWQLRRARNQIKGSDWDAISIQFRLLNEEVVRELKTRVDTVMTWPINTLERLETVRRWGVDGFTSDNLDLIASHNPDRQPQPEDRPRSLTKVDTSSRR